MLSSCIQHLPSLQSATGAFRHKSPVKRETSWSVTPVLWFLSIISPFLLQQLSCILTHSLHLLHNVNYVFLKASTNWVAHHPAMLWFHLVPPWSYSTFAVSDALNTMLWKLLLMICSHFGSNGHLYVSFEYTFASDLLNTESRHQMTGQILSFVYLLNVNEDLRKTLLTPGCHFGRHTPTFTILRSYFTRFHTHTHTHTHSLSIASIFYSILCFNQSLSPIITTFVLCLKIGSIYCCIRFVFIH